MDEELEFVKAYIYEWDNYYDAFYRALLEDAEASAEFVNSLEDWE
jgi:hypothetical protein